MRSLTSKSVAGTLFAFLFVAVAQHVCIMHKNMSSDPLRCHSPELRSRIGDQSILRSDMTANSRGEDRTGLPTAHTKRKEKQL